MPIEKDMDRSLAPCIILLMSMLFLDVRVSSAWSGADIVFSPIWILNGALCKPPLLGLTLGTSYHPRQLI